MFRAHGEPIDQCYQRRPMTGPNRNRIKIELASRYHRHHRRHRHRH